MKKFLPVIFVTLLLAGCTNQKEIDLLKEQNSLLKEQMSGFINKQINSGIVVVSTGIKPSIAKPQVKKANTTIKKVTQDISPKQQAINDAKKKRDICYADIVKVASLISTSCTEGRFKSICEQTNREAQIIAYSKCDTKYEDNLRVISLEY